MAIRSWAHEIPRNTRHVGPPSTKGQIGSFFAPTRSDHHASVRAVLASSRSSELARRAK
jgi:hypothetical protein